MGRLPELTAFDEPPHMAEQKQDTQLEHTYCRSMRIQDVALKTCQRRRTIGKSGKTQAWLQKECYDFVPFSYWLPPSPTWTCWTTSFGHTSRTSPTWPPTIPKPAWLLLSIRRALASACGKGMLPVPDIYRGGDWGWRRLHWIDVSSTAVIEAEGGYIE